MIWRCLLKFKMAATCQYNFFGGCKNAKNCLVNFFWYFNITFIAAWGCASDFLKMLPEFKMAARGRLQIFSWAQKLQNLKIGNYLNFTIHIPHDVLRFCWNSKWPSWINFNFFVGAKNEKLRSKDSHCTITLPTIWECACDFTEIQNGHHKSTF